MIAQSFARERAKEKECILQSNWPAALQGQHKMEPKLLKQIEASSGDINYCSFSPSGQTVASAT